MPHGIVAEGLGKIYTGRKRQRWFRSVREEKLAVQDLSLAIPPGQVTGLLGLNGAGKTTTIKMLSTLLLPSAGHATVDGLDLVRDAARIRRRINMIAGGERMVYGRLTGRENLWYFAQLYDVEPRGLADQIRDLLRLVGLEEAADTPAERYSKGMKQRLQIARGLINDPAYLFLDEPTLGLDAPIARELRQMVRRQAEVGKGVLLTSHYLAEVEELCAHVYVLDRGRLVAQGSPAELKALTHRERTVRVVLPQLSPAVAAAVTHVVNRHGARLQEQHDDAMVTLTIRHPADLSGAVVTAVVVSGGSIMKLEVLEPTLEDAVMALASHQEEVQHA